MEDRAPIIGVAGQAQNGKDTLADHLCISLNTMRGEQYWKRSAFAKAVKQIFMDTFDKDADYVEKWKVVKEAPPDLDKTVRQALQFIGDGFRTIKASIWIDIVMRDINTPRIISDVRYVNELRTVWEHGGYNILVVRPDRINDDPNGSEAQMRPFAEYANNYYLHRKLSGVIERVLDPTKVRLSHEPPEGWNYLSSIVINSGSIEDLYNETNNKLVQHISKFFER